MGEFYSIVPSEEYLAHYGVKGMKWGKHKAKELYRTIFKKGRGAKPNRSVKDALMGRKRGKAGKAIAFRVPTNAELGYETGRRLAQKYGTETASRMAAESINKYNAHKEAAAENAKNVIKDNFHKKTLQIAPNVYTFDRRYFGDRNKNKKKR